MESQAQPAEGDKNVGALYEKDFHKKMMSKLRLKGWTGTILRKNLDPLKPKIRKEM